MSAVRGKVEESRESRRKRNQARFRDRGGIFVPATKNTLLDILLARSVTGASPPRNTRELDREASPLRRSTRVKRDSSVRPLQTETRAVYDNEVDGIEDVQVVAHSIVDSSNDVQSLKVIKAKTVKRNNGRLKKAAEPAISKKSPATKRRGQPPKSRPAETLTKITSRVKDAEILTVAAATKSTKLARKRSIAPFGDSGDPALSDDAVASSSKKTLNRGAVGSRSKTARSRSKNVQTSAAVTKGRHDHGQNLSQPIPNAGSSKAKPRSRPKAIAISDDDDDGPVIIFKKTKSTVSAARLAPLGSPKKTNDNVDSGRSLSEDHEHPPDEVVRSRLARTQSRQNFDSHEHDNSVQVVEQAYGSVMSGRKVLPLTRVKRRAPEDCTVNQGETSEKMVVKRRRTSPYRDVDCPTVSENQATGARSRKVAKKKQTVIPDKSSCLTEARASRKPASWKPASGKQTTRKPASPKSAPQKPALRKSQARQMYISDEHDEDSDSDPINFLS